MFIIQTARSSKSIPFSSCSLESHAALQFVYFLVLHFIVKLTIFFDFLSCCIHVFTLFSNQYILISRLINGIQNFIKDLTNIDFWKNVLVKVLKFASVPSSTRIDNNGECVAKEVFRYKDRSGYFASSVEARSPRPSKVAYRVGQVVRHKRWGYRGVIIGWDVKAKVSFHMKNACQTYPNMRNV